MTIFRFSFLLFLGAVLAGGLFYVRQEHVRQEQFAKVQEFAKACSFPVQRVTLDDQDKAAAFGQVSIRGLYLDCETNPEIAALACLEGRMKKAGIQYRPPAKLRNCAALPPHVLY